MTKVLYGEDVAGRIDESISGAVVRYNRTDVWIKAKSLLDVSQFLKDTADLDFNYLVSVSSVDYIEYFELIYHLVSMRQNHSTVLKVQCEVGRENPVVPSIISIWNGADLQEREVWDLMGIHFEGHPNMKRILLWEGFPDHPLRKDFLG